MSLLRIKLRYVTKNKNTMVSLGCQCSREITTESLLDVTHHKLLNPIQVDVASVTRLIYLCQAVPSNRISSQRLESDSFTAATSSRESSCDRHVPAAGRTRARHLSISFYRMPPSHDLNIEQHDLLVFFTTSSRKPPLKSFQEARIRINRT